MSLSRIRDLVPQDEILWELFSLTTKLHTPTLSPLSRKHSTIANSNNNILTNSLLLLLANTAELATAKSRTPYKQH